LRACCNCPAAAPRMPMQLELFAGTAANGDEPHRCTSLAYQNAI
jgi:hypothetical protein